MSNKVALLYEEGEFNVSMNGMVLHTDRDIEHAFEAFKQVLKNNTSGQTKAWEKIEAAIRFLDPEDIEINSTYRTLSFGPMKYFYNTDKVFYIGEGKMIPLTGGYRFFEFVLTLVSDELIHNPESLVELCKKVIENKAIYSIKDSSIMVASAVFSYGSVTYNFSTHKMDKGTTSEQSSFEDFKAYILKSIE